MADIEILANAGAVAHAAANAMVDAAESAIGARGHFTIALSGGSTPQALYELLATDEYRDRIDWGNTFVFWGDERAVPPDDEASSYRMAHESLLGRVPIPQDNIYRIQGEGDANAAAADYEQQLRTFFGARAPGASIQPRFDLILLGMGDDGHTASLFPETEALDEEARWVIAHFVPKVDMWRISLTAPAINAARQIIFLVTGAGKADTLRDVLEGPRRPRQLPAQLIQPINGSLLWLVDEAAAARLSHGGGQGAH